MSGEKRYKIVLGASIERETGSTEDDFMDMGVVYRNLKYDQVVQVEQVLAKHGPKLAAAMQEIGAELAAIGAAEVQQRTGRQVQSDAGAIR